MVTVSETLYPRATVDPVEASGATIHVQVCRRLGDVLTPVSGPEVATLALIASVTTSNGLQPERLHLETAAGEGAGAQLTTGISLEGRAELRLVDESGSSPDLVHVALHLANRDTAYVTTSSVTSFDLAGTAG
ncbi:MAG: hypothetical protein AAGN66_17825 [Acidobacteriota bacterium]